MRAETPTRWLLQLQVVLVVLLAGMDISSGQKPELIEVYKENCPTLETMKDQYIGLIQEMLNKTLPTGSSVDVKEFQCQNIVDITKTVCQLLLSSDTTRKLFHTKCKTGRHLKSLFRSLDVTHEKLQFESKCVGDASGQEDSIRSRVSEVAQLFEDLMNRWGWLKIIVFTDLDVASVVKEFSVRFLSVVIVRVSKVEGIRAYLSKDQFKSNYANHFFLLCNPIKTVMVLSEAQNYKLLDEPNTWIVMSDVAEDELFRDFAVPYNTFVALATATSFTPSSQQNAAALILADLDNKKNQEAISKTCRDFSSETRVKTAPTSQGQQGTQLAKLAPLVIDLKEIYCVKNELPISSQSFGRWSSESRLNMWRPFPDMLRNLNGLQLDIVSHEVAPFVTLTNTDGVWEMGGYYGEILQVLAKEINFTYTLRPVDDRTYGELIKGKWNGMIAELVNKKSDLAICDISLTNDRKEAVEFSPGLSHASVKIFYKKPGEKFHFRLYILPFDFETWMLVIVSMVVSGCALHVASKLSPNSSRQQLVVDEKEKVKAEHDFSLANCLLVAYDGFVQQGADVDPKDLPGKIIFVTIYMSFVIVFSSYTSIFTSFLTIKDTKLQFETLKEVLADSSFSLGVQKGTSQLNYIQNRDEMSAAWKVMQKDPANLVDSIEAGLERAKKMKYAFLTPEEATTFVLKEGVCEFDIAKEVIIHDTFHMAYQKNFLYKETFDAYIHRLIESGILQRIQKHFEWSNVRCDSGSDVQSLGFKRVVSLFLLLGGAAVAASVILTFEKIVYPRLGGGGGKADRRMLSLKRWNPTMHQDKHNFAITQDAHSDSPRHFALFNSPGHTVMPGYNLPGHTVVPGYGMRQDMFSKQYIFQS